MTLDGARIELEKQGLSCEMIHEYRLAGVSTTLYRELCASIHLLIFVQQVPGLLTLERISADLKLLPLWVERRLAGSKACGIGIDGRQVMLVYYAETVAPDAVEEITQKACENDRTMVKFVAGQDAAGQPFFLPKAKTPWLNWAFYPDFRYRAKKLTGCPVQETEPPGYPCWIRVYNAIAWILLIPFIVYTCIADPFMIFANLGIFAYVCLVVAGGAWWRTCEHKQNVARAIALEEERGETDNNVTEHDELQSQEIQIV
ncbi:MAG: hypothetical protein SGILL_010849 [Bacillariaceae sp.]